MSEQLTVTENKPKIPKAINVLTILTFIGCGLSLVFTILGKALSKWAMSFADKAIESGAELSAKQMEDIQKGKEAMAIMEKNWTMILLTSLLFTALCFAGAFMMRKLKKDGYWLYLVGEVGPYITSAVFMGSMAFSGAGSFIFPAISLVFIILYTVNRKHLTK